MRSPEKDGSNSPEVSRLYRVSRVCNAGIFPVYVASRSFGNDPPRHACHRGKEDGDANDDRKIHLRGTLVHVHFRESAALFFDGHDGCPPWTARRVTGARTSPRPAAPTRQREFFKLIRPWELAPGVSPWESTPGGILPDLQIRPALGGRQGRKSRFRRSRRQCLGAQK